MYTKKKRHVFRLGMLALMALLFSLVLPVRAQAQSSAAEAYQKA